MKYKLKKWYPSLPKGIKEGDIVWKPQNREAKKHWGYTTDRLALSGTCIPEEEVENNPDFWEPVEEKNYEVLSLKYTGDNKLTPRILKDKANIEAYLNGYGKSRWAINSVKRLSDGQVFTVGDKTNKGIIHSFTAYCASIHTCVVGENGYDHFNGDIKKLDPIKEESLFTAEDGVDIYGGDHYFVPQKVLGSDIPIDEILKFKATSNENYSKDNSKRFSTKEKAEEYVDRHKPRFSKADIEHVFNESKYEESLGEFIYTVLKKLDQ